jgi:hypothetical protein
MIHWNDDRLRTLWKVLTQLHDKGVMGNIRATACSTIEGTARTSPQVAAGNDFVWPEHIRVACDAHLALPLRSALGLVSAQERRVPETKGAAPSVKFLKNVRLLWVDEEGLPVLLA